MTLRNKALAIVLMFLPAAGWAQQVAQDASIRTGRLDNGMTYYIRHNAKEPKIADFYIAQRVGSILEEPHQRGLAHFLEHMAFNGTEHFRGDGSKSLGIVPWCETVGIKFGGNLNAYTSVDQTVYNISSAPTQREGVVDSCLLILHDWSHSLLLTDKEIDKERGVIHEEWRTRRAGMAVQRLMEKALPTVYKGTKYEDCLPIGSMDVVDKFKYKALRDYYKKWYRPDLQAIIVVGDIDVDLIEKKIKTLFSPIPKAKNPAERIYYPVTDNDRMIVAIEKDAEQPIVLAKLYMKRDATPDSEKGTEQYQRDGYIDWMIRYMLNQRIAELQHSQQPPFISASASSGQFFVTRTKDAFSIQVGCKQDDIAGSLTSVIAETERVRQHGFTAAELERAKAKYMKSAERQYAERDSRRNSYFVSKCVRNFTAAEPMLSETEDLRLAKKFDKEVTLSEVNKAANDIITDRNQVLTVYAPDKEGVNIPTADEFEDIILKAQAGSYEAYKEAEISPELMPVKPQPGTIVAEKDYGRHGVKEFTLSNGIKVYVKPTDFNADQITFRLFADGGTSLCDESDAPNFSFIASAISEAGVADCDVFTLRKKLAGRIVRVSPYVENDTHGINGSSSVKDMEAMLQLANLYFTSPRTDYTAFNSMLERRRSLYRNREASPMVSYNDSVSAVLYGDNPRTEPVKLATLDKVDYSRIMQIYRERFSDASGFKALFIGNVNIDSLRPMLCQYLASLPAAGKKETAADTYPAIRNANETHLFIKKQATPSSMVSVYYTADMPFTAENDLRLDVLKRVLQIAYTDSVREEKGGTYGVSVSFDLDRYSKPDAMLKISFRCDPARYAELTPIVYRQLSLIAENGPIASSLDKVKKYLIKQYVQNSLSNDYWLYVIYNDLHSGIDYHTGYTDMVNRITADDVKATAKELLRQNRRLEITMKSE